MSFGVRFRKLRKSRKLNQGEMAKALGISQQMVSCYEGDKSTPDAELLEKIAAFFKVSIDYLFGREEKDTEDQLTIESYINLPPDKKIVAKQLIKFLQSSEDDNE